MIYLQVRESAIYAKDDVTLQALVSASLEDSGPRIITRGDSAWWSGGRVSWLRCGFRCTGVVARFLGSLWCLVFPFPIAMV